MTQISRFWNGVAVGDAAGVAPYDANEEFAAVMSAIGGIDSDTNKGAVVANTLNELACSGIASPVSIATGKAIVDGTWYSSDAVVSLAVTMSYGYILLEKDCTAQTVRVKISESNVGYPALTQTSGAAGVWQYPLASFTLDGGGVVAITDMRTFIGMRTMRLISSYVVAGAGIHDIVFSNIPQGYTNLKLVGSVRSAAAGEDVSFISYNGVTGTSYSGMDVATARNSAGAGAATVFATENTGVGGSYVCNFPGSTELANSWAIFEVLISDYTSATKRTRAHSKCSYFLDETGGSSYLVYRDYISIGPVGPITSISLHTSGGDDYATGTKVSLYGLP